MSYERNIETQNALKRDIKAVKSSCLGMCQIITNAPLENATSSQEVYEKILGYIEGMKTEVQNSNTPIPTDDNLLTSQFLNEIMEKTNQVEELTIFTKGCIHDVDVEINRLKSLMKVANEAKSRPRVGKRQIKAEHILKAKERFHMMKTELHGLTQSLIPNNDVVIDILGQLMSERINEESSGCIAVTTENYQVIELLKDLNIVTTNPYNNMEVKLAY